MVLIYIVSHSENHDFEFSSLNSQSSLPSWVGFTMPIVRLGRFEMSPGELRFDAPRRAFGDASRSDESDEEQRKESLQSRDAWWERTDGFSGEIPRVAAGGNF